MTQALAMESLARACAGTFWAVSISTLLCGKILSTLCGPQHHWQWLQSIIAGNKIGCFAASEQGAGSDPSSYRTSLRMTKRGLVLSGEKLRISNATTADVAVVLARRQTPHGAALCYVVVDLHQRRIQRREIPKLGLGAMSWGSVHFDDVEIAAADVIDHASIERTLHAVEWGQVLQTFCALGIAQACLAACRAHGLTREAFGRPIAHLPVVHCRLADMHAEMDAARQLAFEACWIKGQGGIARESVLMAKIHATEMAVRVAGGPAPSALPTLARPSRLGRDLWPIHPRYSHWSRAVGRLGRLRPSLPSRGAGVNRHLPTRFPTSRWTFDLGSRDIPIYPGAKSGKIDQ